MKTAKYLLLLALMLAGTFKPLYSQMPEKKTLTVKEYDRWHQLFTNNCSNQGNWISYTHHYESNKDTLFIKNTKSLKTYAFAKGFNPTFIAESKVIVQQSENKLIIFDLEKESIQQLENAVEYALAKNNLYITIKQVVLDKTKLLIVDTMGKILKEIPNVVHWKMNPNNNKVAYYSVEGEIHTMQIVDLERKPSTTSVVESDRPLMQLQWNTTGTTLAFLSPRSPKAEQDDKGVLFCYNTETHQLKTLKLTNQNGIPAHSINETYSTELRISEDGQRVFFGVEETAERPVPDPSAVQVWNTADKSIYPGKIEMNDWRRRPIISVWRPQTGKITPITDNNLPFIQLDAKMKYAVTYNPTQYNPQFKYQGDRDYYLTNLETGEKSLFLKAASGEPSDLIASPDGKYFMYFQDFTWWSYELESGKRTNLTQKIKLVSLQTNSGVVTGDGLESRIAGFSNKDKNVFIYDQFDIWRINTDGSSFAKLTAGRETKTQFRILNGTQSKVGQYIYDGYQTPEYQTSVPLYFKGTNEVTQENGIYTYGKAKVTKNLLLKSALITEIKWTEDNKKIMYTAQSAERPPHLVYFDLKHSKEKVIHQSNPQYVEYELGKSEIFSFDVEGKKVYGVLKYPANYNAQKKYPMVVHIYENQTPYFHIYQNPTLFDSSGFNIANYTTQGYFVCLPNMLFEIGNTGEVATNCINVAVQNIIDKDIIDKGRIGLIGHSYGGYETNFIVTQKNPFKTAVSGASYSDLAADYLHVAWDDKTEDYRRFEHGQMRMGGTLFEFPNRFHKNSPMLLAENISIPLLLWSGAEDRHVDVNQSYKLHMALRRLQKENVMLIYPNERHTIETPKNQLDLNTKIKEWFDYLLNDGERKPWMVPNFLEN